MPAKKSKKVAHFHIGLLVLFGVVLLLLVSQLLNQQSYTSESQAAGMGNSCNARCDTVRGQVCAKGLTCVRVGADNYRCRNARNPQSSTCSRCLTGWVGKGCCSADSCTVIDGNCVCGGKSPCKGVPSDPPQCFPTLPPL